MPALGAAGRQVQPDSIAQTLEHPSKLHVLPSSQASVPWRIPSPHFWQTAGLEAEQAQPDSMAHTFEQPSLEAVLPSSQASVP